MDWFLALKWATPSEFDRSVEFGAYATWYIGQHSGPTQNPDDCYLKDIIFGVAPYDVVGVSTLEWWHTDPVQWQIDLGIRALPSACAAFDGFKCLQ
jgi:hypothetical protein